MNRSFHPPRIRPQLWAAGTCLAALGAVGGTCLAGPAEGWIHPALCLGLALALAHGWRRAATQQRISDAATLFSLETGEIPGTLPEVDRDEIPDREEDLQNVA